VTNAKRAGGGRRLNRRNGWSRCVHQRQCCSIDALTARSDLDSWLSCAASCTHRSNMGPVRTRGMQQPTESELFLSFIALLPTKHARSRTSHAWTRAHHQHFAMKLWPFWPRPSPRPSWRRPASLPTSRRSSNTSTTALHQVRLPPKG
jgi:hypothetical protein